MTTFNAIIFDLDGTLVHSAPDLHSAANVALAKLSRAPLDLETVISFVGHGVEKLVERSLKATGDFTVELHRDALAIFLESYEANKTTLTQPYPGVVACLARLSAAGVPLGICTNKPTGPAREICAELDLTQYFEVIAGAEPDVAKKPDPEPLLTCISDLGARVENALYVGDSSIDFQTAQNAQVPFRLFTEGYLNGKIPDLSEDERFSDWAAVDLLQR